MPSRAPKRTVIDVVSFISAVVVVVIILAFLIAVVRFVWVAGSAPGVAAYVAETIIGSSFLQALAALFTAAATVALWVVTRSIMRVTKVQVHAQVAPLIATAVFLRSEPPQSQEEQGYPLMPYEFAYEDTNEPEINAFHNLTPDENPKRYILLLLANAQAQSSYGIATDVEVDVILTFPRFATAQNAVPSWAATPAQKFELQRTLKVPLLMGQQPFWVTAFRVDSIPYWDFRNLGIRFRDFRGKGGTFAVGTVSAHQNESGFTVVSGRWDPQPGEQPQ